MSLASLNCDKDKIIPKLKLVVDEPDYLSDLFGYEIYTNQIYDFLKYSVPDKPFAICLEGEWGSGKTSLLKRIYFKLHKEEVADHAKTKVIWFDAWQYEKLDPVKALMQSVIEKSWNNHAAKEKLCTLLKGMLFLTSDVITKKTLDKEMDKILEYFGLTVKEINSFSQTLDDAIGDGRLIIFIDDLDRCSVDNIIDMLEAIKLLFSANKATFVVGVDIRKLERAWTLRHGGRFDALVEGKEHLDKIFQLKLSLPRKDDAMIKEYIKSMADDLPPEVERFLLKGVPYNPRLIKRILNLLYFISTGIKNEEFNEYFPYVLIWSVLTTSFPKIAREVRQNPMLLIHLCGLVKQTTDHDHLKRRLAEIKDTKSSTDGRRLNVYQHLNLAKYYNPTAESLLYDEVAICNDLDRFLRATADSLALSTNLESHNDIVEKMRRTIYYAGLIS